MTFLPNYLTETQAESLARAPFDLLVLEALPDGWSVQSVTLTEEDEGEVDVQLLFSGPAGSRFELLATNGGVGDALPGEESSLVEHATLGTVYLEHYRENGKESFQSQWIETAEDGAWVAVRGAGVTDRSAQSALIGSLVPYRP